MLLLPNPDAYLLFTILMNGLATFDTTYSYFTAITELVSLLMLIGQSRPRDTYCICVFHPRHILRRLALYPYEQKGEPHCAISVAPYILSSTTSQPEFILIRGEFDQARLPQAPVF
jgi:hypothetical protein